MVPVTPAVLNTLPPALTSPFTMVELVSVASPLVARSPFDPAVAGLYGPSRESQLSLPAPLLLNLMLDDPNTAHRNTPLAESTLWTGAGSARKGRCAPVPIHGSASARTLVIARPLIGSAPRTARYPRCSGRQSSTDSATAN